METKEILQDAVDKLLFWAMDEKRSHIVTKASEVFLKGAESDVEMLGFNDWFVHDYRDKNNKSIAKLYIEDKQPSADEIKILTAVETSVYGAFDRMPIKDKMVLKDMFTKLDYQLENNFEAGSVMLVRIYKIDGKHMILDLPEFLPQEYQSTLVKGMLEKYNEYCRLFSPIQMEVFVKTHSQVLYRFLNIIDNTAAEFALDEEDFVVHQSTFVTKNMSEAHEILKNNKNFILALDDAAGAVFKLITGEHQDVVAEIVLADDRLEIECTSAESLEFSKDQIADVLSDYVTHLRDDVLNLDDLLG